MGLVVGTHVSLVSCHHDTMTFLDIILYILIFNIFRFGFDQVSIFVWDTEIEIEIFWFQEIKIKAKTKFWTRFSRFRLVFSIFRFITHLYLYSQHTTLSYYIFKNKHNHTQSILIPIYKSNKIRSLLRCY